MDTSKPSPGKSSRHPRMNDSLKEAIMAMPVDGVTSILVDREVVPSLYQWAKSHGMDVGRAVESSTRTRIWRSK